MKKFTLDDADNLKALCEEICDQKSTDEIIKAVYRMRKFLAQSERKINMRGLTPGKWEFASGKNGIVYYSDGKEFTPSIKDFYAMSLTPELCNEVVKLYHAVRNDDEDTAVACTAQLFGIVRKLGLIAHE